MKILTYLSLIIAIVGFTLSTGCNKAPSCSDGIQNQGERGIDCSGPCLDRCDCFNGVIDGEETGIDCGGRFCTCCEPPCQPRVEPSACLEMPAEAGSFQVNMNPPISKKPNAFILESSGQLIIKISNPDNSGGIQINQTVSGFFVDEFDVKGSGITSVHFLDVDGKNYYSQVEGSAGKVTFTEFVNQIDCKYVSGTFEVTLFTQNKDSNILISGDFREVCFLGDDKEC